LAFAKNSPYGNCQLEYITNLNKLKIDYGFRAAKHPMVGNPAAARCLTRSNDQSSGSVWFAELSRKDPICAAPRIEIKVEGRKSSLFGQSSLRISSRLLRETAQRKVCEI